MNTSTQFIDTSSKSFNPNDPHAVYVYNKSLLCIIKRLLHLKQSNQNIILSLKRYQYYMEKLIYDIHEEKIKSKQAEILRVKHRTHKHDDLIQQVVQSECKLLTNLKRTLESKLDLLMSTIKNIKCIQHKLDQWINEHKKMVTQFDKDTEKFTKLTLLDNQIETLNNSYSTSMDLDKIFKMIDFTVSHIDTLQYDLLVMFERIKQFLTGTRNSVYYALIEDCTFVVKQMRQLFVSNLKHKMAHNQNLKMINQIMSQRPNKSNEKIMQKLLENNEQLQKVRREVTIHFDQLNHHMQADLQTMRNRRKQQGEHLLRSNDQSPNLVVIGINPQIHEI
ncbi:unnamed protein product [Heterobilharzia americana]|nr:unnamed protein product [Heterobilharzia americana]